MKKTLQSINMGLMKLIAMSTPSCEVIGRKISESFDKKLTIKERIQIKIHLLGCTFCMRYREQLIKLHNMASKLAKEFENDKRNNIKLDESVKIKIKENIKKHKY